ncbi:hypothetical protein OH809_44535 (plasmid) [Streptomyces sp. NBC_00873]|uniref:hypothetical protein n=1 Tax=unclassified Streptomyces TaxID=2593676 RepID=UPI002F906EF2|nr:hypothetical protein OH809_44535 [Streptomyces sp. NBC_00873]WTA49270.1 hypothetical protein OH821_44105 [Streptomyces sp. NBC_00842]
MLPSERSGHRGQRSVTTKKLGTWPLLHVTQAGRDHVEEHREAYTEHHPGITPVRAAAAAGTGR